jgi:hypothetical protein
MQREFHHRATWLLGALLATVWGALAPFAPPVRAADAPPAPRIEDAWIRWLPGNLPEGGYLRITNVGDVPLVLLGASSPEFAQISLHRSVNQGGSMSMEPVAQLRIAPHASVDFAANGYHLMLMQPRSTLKPGDGVPILLRFASGPSISVRFAVRGAEAQ